MTGRHDPRMMQMYIPTIVDKFSMDRDNPYLLDSDGCI